MIPRKDQPYNKWLSTKTVISRTGFSAVVLRKFREMGVIDFVQPAKGSNFLYDPEDVERLASRKRN